MTSSPPDLPPKRKASDAGVRTLAGLSGFGGRPSLHPSWREPDNDSLAEPAEPAPVLVIRLSGPRTA